MKLRCCGRNARRDPGPIRDGCLLRLHAWSAHFQENNDCVGLSIEDQWTVFTFLVTVRRHKIFMGIRGIFFFLNPTFIWTRGRPLGFGGEVLWKCHL